LWYELVGKFISYNKGRHMELTSQIALEAATEDGSIERDRRLVYEHLLSRGPSKEKLDELWKAANVLCPGDSSTMFERFRATESQSQALKLQDDWDTQVHCSGFYGILVDCLRDGFTSHEIFHSLLESGLRGIKINGVTPRPSELQSAGLVACIGVRPCKITTHLAKIWVAKKGSDLQYLFKQTVKSQSRIAELERLIAMKDATIADLSARLGL
jgi:hypothetical protein